MKIYLIFLTILSITFLEAKDSVNPWIRPDAIPTPTDNPITEEKVKLGKLLFFDKRLSKSDTISCATCHNPRLGWSDGQARAIGDQNRVGRRNSPTIINSAYQDSYFHDGRADSLEEQAIGPIEAEVEMNMPIDKLVKKLDNIKGYRKLFFKAFGKEGISKETIAKAMASFERTIISPESAFDRWINGDKDAISADAKEGFDIFLNVGKCESCHNSFNFTNGSFNNVGLGDRNDLGLYEITKSKIWYGSFKTPTLRDIEKSAPYFHDGSVKDLEEAVRLCGNGGRRPVQLRSPFFRDRKLDTNEVKKIVLFLKTLTSVPVDINIPKIFPN